MKHMPLMHAPGIAPITGPSISLQQLIGLKHQARDIPLFSHQASASVHSGQQRSRFRGRGMDFDEVRIYQAGDDIRHIDWRVTARTSRPHTKLFREERDRPVLVMVDQRQSMCFGSRITYKSVLAAELASIAAWAALANNDKVGGIVFNEKDLSEIKPRRNKQALLALLKQLADYNQCLLAAPQAQSQPKAELTLSAVLQRLQYVARPGSSIFLASDFSDYDEAAENILWILRRHCEIHALLVCDPLEQQLPGGDLLPITDGAHKKMVNGKDSRLLETYRKNFVERQTGLTTRLARLGIHCQACSTVDDPRQLLLQLGRHRA